MALSTAPAHVEQIGQRDLSLSMLPRTRTTGVVVRKEIKQQPIQRRLQVCGRGIRGRGEKMMDREVMEAIRILFAAGTSTLPLGFVFAVFVMRKGRK